MKQRVLAVIDLIFGMSVSVSLMRGKGDTNLFRLFVLGMELV